MQPKTEEFLNFLLWSAEMLARPSFRNVTESYEGWAYRHGLLRQLKTLEGKQWIERDGKYSNDRIYRLTEAGRLHVLGGRDPVARWKRHWDGRWRLVLFDLPVAQNARRAKLRRYLYERGFGCLQGSVWITPDALDEEYRILEGGGINVNSLLLLDARPCAAESDQDIVNAAWDFESINELYEEHLEILDQHPSGAISPGSSANELQRWGTQERLAWLKAVSADPLLPDRLLPQGYLGRQAWKRRIDVLRKAGEQLQAFTS